MISHRSRYATSILFTDGPEEFLGACAPSDTTPRSDDRFHTIVEGDRLDVLAERYLGRAEFWWVIADWNEIEWPFELETGAVLRIPSLATIADQLSS